MAKAQIDPEDIEKLVDSMYACQQFLMSVQKAKYDLVRSSLPVFHERLRELVNNDEMLMDLGNHLDTALMASVDVLVRDVYLHFQWQAMEPHIKALEMFKADYAVAQVLLIDLYKEFPEMQKR